MSRHVRSGALACGWVALLLACWPGCGRADTRYGPWNVSVMAGSVGFGQKLPMDAQVLAATADWSATAWVRPLALPAGRQLLAGYGAVDGSARYFMADAGHLAFWWGHGQATVSTASLRPGQWQFVAAVVRQGRFHLYLDGREVDAASAPAETVPAQMGIAPVQQPWPAAAHFGGQVADFSLRSDAEDAATIRRQAQTPPDPALIQFVNAAEDWPIQTRQMGGQVVPQEPSTLPHSRAPFSRPVAVAVPAQPALRAQGADTWVLDDWQLASATDLGHADGAQLSAPAANVSGKAWLQATVPGTVLTTLVDRGIYPDPAYGLDNMAIPESLHQHDWWYRTRFDAPAQLAGHHLELTFNGINYAAEVWVNGQRVGDIRGAFVRGRFDVTSLLKPGQANAIAVRMSPPPDPGVAHEQSLAAGPGPNGGMQALDGPTFIASEGWDWIPAIRDRDTGLWQDVTLHATGAVRIGDPHVVTRLPLPDLSHAEVDIDVPLENPGTQPVSGTLHVAFGDVRVERAVTVPPGGTVVHLAPANAPQLDVHDPHMWWPNGYGDPYLYRLSLDFTADGAVSDSRALDFGIRQISYELSLFDQAGNLDRVLVTPDRTREPGERILDVTHRGIHRTTTAWAYSLLPGALQSPAVQPLRDDRLSPYLAIRVNGVRIAIKGGSWGTDDFIKRVSRARLEPYFKLQQQAHFNVIRNWVGQSTEPAFYDLADRYGMLVFNDFWQSTQDYNLEPMDDALFMRNAEDVIRRYRNHPSIALWFGRNEGVPQPLLNQLLDKAIAKLDGTRLYMPSSNRINLWESGPYNYRLPEQYFTQLSQGFAVEVGTPSFPTLEAFEAMMPAADQWPISDDWAYHDWHQASNGDVASFMAAMQNQFGAPTSLADFERKAQLMNYVSYRAIFEGMNARLWTRNSGRLLWMSHPAWPSTTWQVYSHDYDTQASYYGAKHASEPVHVQMNLPDRQIMVVDDTTRAIHGAQLDIDAYALDGHLLAHATRPVEAAAVAATPVDGGSALDALVDAHGVVFVALALYADDSHLLSRNFYWTAAKPEDLRQLDQLPAQALRLSVQGDGPGRLRVSLANPGRQVVLGAKLTLVDAQGKRILPAYYSDNYIDLVPGGTREIEISVDAGGSLAGAQVQLRGWNVVPATGRAP